MSGFFSGTSLVLLWAFLAFTTLGLGLYVAQRRKKSRIALERASHKGPPKDPKDGLGKSGDLPSELVHDEVLTELAYDERLEPPFNTNVEQAKKSEPTQKQRLGAGLSKTALFFQQTLDRVMGGSAGSQFYEDLEEAFLSADVGLDFAESVTLELRKIWGVKIPFRQQLKEALAHVLTQRVPQPLFSDVFDYEGLRGAKPRIIMVVGVNGVGKTTTIAKLCHHFKAHGKSVLVGAADTFRAAATEQLKTWVERLGVDGVFQAEGSDPSAVTFDSVQAAQSRGHDICIIDTAGRLHTKVNLMEELQKVKRVIGKALGLTGSQSQDFCEVWLVVDGSTGQNALTQAREFHRHLGLTGLIVTKLDGTAKGGALLSITSELNVPVLLIGVGESPEDLIIFERGSFVETILSDLGESKTHGPIQTETSNLHSHT